ncbi:hypothetical protein FHE72_04505 [Rossellomorea vietnamensis]|uniref:Uncharacterized protein n=1 Tax=Rossellomorea vietnamensis TaxID=218284 RepID=A0A6I6UNW1_9BACI|nr:hypothetical protein FHE72_04505 [Rossellomorea vietnamensis]
MIDEKYHDGLSPWFLLQSDLLLKVDSDYRKIASNELIVYDIELSSLSIERVGVEDPA